MTVISVTLDRDTFAIRSKSILVEGKGICLNPRNKVSDEDRNIITKELGKLVTVVTRTGDQNVSEAMKTHTTREVFNSDLLEYILIGCK